MAAKELDFDIEARTRLKAGVDKLARAVKDSFGSFDAFKDAFSNAAANRFGSGSRQGGLAGIVFKPLGALFEPGGEIAAAGVQKTAVAGREGWLAGQEEVNG